MSRVNLLEMAARGEEAVQNTRAGLAAAARVEAGMAHLQGELARTNEIAEKAARHHEELAIRARIADEEKQEQKEIKNAVFSFKQDLDIVLKGSNGLKRYIGLKSLSDVGKMELARYTSKLNELNDKEFANNLLNTVYDSAKEAFRSLTDEEKNDLRKFEQLWAIQKEFDDLTEVINDAQMNLSSRQAEMVQYKQEYKPTSRIGGVIMLLLVIGFTIMFVGIPLPLLLVGGIRRWVWSLYKSIVNGTKLANESAHKVSATQQEISKLESSRKAANASLEATKIKLAANQNELTSLFSKYDLSAS